MCLSARRPRLQAEVRSQGRQRYRQGMQVNLTGPRSAEEVLRDGASRLRTAVTNVPVVLFALDNGGVITLSGGKGLEALGLEPNKAVGRSLICTATGLSSWRVLGVRSPASRSPRP